MISANIIIRTNVVRSVVRRFDEIGDYQLTLLRTFAEKNGILNISASWFVAVNLDIWAPKGDTCLLDYLPIQVLEEIAAKNDTSGTGHYAELPISHRTGEDSWEEISIRPGPSIPGVSSYNANLSLVKQLIEMRNNETKMQSDVYAEVYDSDTTDKKEEKEMLNATINYEVTDLDQDVIEVNETRVSEGQKSLIYCTCEKNGYELTNEDFYVPVSFQEYNDTRHPILVSYLPLAMISSRSSWTDADGVCKVLTLPVFDLDTANIDWREIRLEMPKDVAGKASYLTMSEYLFSMAQTKAYLNDYLSR